MPATTIVVLFLFGTVIGSFLNVVALRSLTGESILWPPSRCPACGHRLAVLDLIPILSYLALWGRCRYCGCRISLQYPLVEATTGAVFAVLFARYGLTLEFLRFAVLVSALIVSTVTDFKEMSVSYAPLFVAMVATVTLQVVGGHINEVLGDIITGTIFVLTMILLVLHGSVGEGDIPVGILIILGFSFKQVITVFFIAAILGGLYGCVLLAKDSQNRKRLVPLVPFLTASSLVVAVWPSIAQNLFWWWL